MVVKLEFHRFSGIITPKNEGQGHRGLFPVCSTNILFFLPLRLMHAGERRSRLSELLCATTIKKLTLCWCKRVLGRSVDWPTSQAIIIGWPHNQNVFLIIVLHGVRCQGSSILNSLDSTFHCPQGTALSQVENVIPHTTEWKTKMNIIRGYFSPPECDHRTLILWLWEIASVVFIQIISTSGSRLLQFLQVRKCPNSCMIKLSEILLNQDGKLF